MKQKSNADRELTSKSGQNQNWTPRFRELTSKKQVAVIVKFSSMTDWVFLSSEIHTYFRGLKTSAPRPPLTTAQISKEMILSRFLKMIAFTISRLTFNFKSQYPFLYIYCNVLYTTFLINNALFISVKEIWHIMIWFKVKTSLF